jgi:hypothetical protein
MQLGAGVAAFAQEPNTAVTLAPSPVTSDAMLFAKSR